MNPDQETKPTGRTAPTEPEPFTEFGDDKKWEIHKNKRKEFREQLGMYDRQKKALNELVHFIQETITVQYAVYIEKESHPWDQLAALKRRLAPSDDARKLELEQRYARIKQGPGNQDLEKWLDEWSIVVEKANTAKIAEVSENRPVRDFLLAIRNKYSSWTDSQLSTVNKKTVNDLPEIVESFRQFIRITQLNSNGNKSGSHSAFAVDQEIKDTHTQTTTETSFRGRKIQTPRACLCGETHWFSECPYLTADARPAHWRADPAIRAKVDEELKEDKTRDKVNKALEKHKAYNERQKSRGRNKSKEDTAELPATPTPPPRKAFACIRTTFSAFSADTYSLRGSWILDGGSNTHVCNSTMRSRFTSQRSAHGEFLISGNTQLRIECYGTIDITIRGPKGPDAITLLNVAYVPDFMTNVVSQDILRSKGLYFDNWKMHLHEKGVSFGFVTPYNGHYLMEDNTSKTLQTSPEETSVFATKVATTNQWHQILAHASDDAIKHLETSAEGVKVSDKDIARAPPTNKCEPCALSKAHRIISRSPFKSETSDLPFYRITYDLIPLNSSMTRDQWVSHFACASTDFNLVYTHPHKSAATDIIRKAINLIHTRYNAKVVFFRSDGERALGIEFEKFISEKGITYEASAPDTPEQNGHSERKGRILTTKARSMRIQGRLPMDLWSELVKTAGYIANRTPMQKHGWKTPYELVNKTPPSLSHLHPIGCKAYSLDKHIPRKEKMQERAHIGHLVGYDSTNIFRIWIPSRSKIIRTRDVMFDDEVFYNPKDLDEYAASEPMIEVRYQSIRPRHEMELTEILSDSSDDEPTTAHHTRKPRTGTARTTRRTGTRRAQGFRRDAAERTSTNP